MSTKNFTVSRISVDIAARNNFEYVKAVQNDIETRYVYITLLDGGIPYAFSNGDIVIRGTKPDGKVIFNYCSLTEENEIVVALTPQMLSVAGRSVYEIAIYDKQADNGVLLTSFPFYLLVSETSYDGTVVESSHEFKALLDIMTNAVSINELGEKVIDASCNIKEIGKTIREDSANAKKYAELSESYSENSKLSEQAAKTSETNAKASETAAKEHLDRVTEITESFSFTKEDVGLGNVDNTPDAEKSVLYAASAGTAENVTWNRISDRPDSFPPSAHTHSEYSAASHSHNYSSIAGAPSFRLEGDTFYIDLSL